MRTGFRALRKTVLRKNTDSHVSPNEGGELRPNSSVSDRDLLVSQLTALQGRLASLWRKEELLRERELTLLKVLTFALATHTNDSETESDESESEPESETPTESETDSEEGSASESDPEESEDRRPGTAVDSTSDAISGTSEQDSQTVAPTEPHKGPESVTGEPAVSDLPTEPASSAPAVQNASEVSPESAMDVEEDKEEQEGNNLEADDLLTEPAFIPSMESGADVELVEDDEGDAVGELPLEIDDEQASERASEQAEPDSESAADKTKTVSDSTEESASEEESATEDSQAETGSTVEQTAAGDLPTEVLSRSAADVVSERVAEPVMEEPAVEDLQTGAVPGSMGKAAPEINLESHEETIEASAIPAEEVSEPAEETEMDSEAVTEEAEGGKLGQGTGRLHYTRSH